MNGFDVSMIPMIFLGFQAIIVGLYVLVNIFLGRKRGVTNTVWFFAGEIILVFVLLWGLGLVQTNDWVTEAMVRQYISFMPMGSGELNQYMDEIVASGMLPVFLAIVDLSVKMSIFVLFYTILRAIFKWIIFGIPWLIFIKPIVKDKTKNKTLGGLVGVFRGAFGGFFLIFPVLIIINTVVGAGVEIDDPEYHDLAVAISDANEYNFVKYINDATKVEGTGLADFMFDLAFRSKVNEEETIVWRLELKWIAEAGKAALPYILDESAEVEITLAEITKFEGVFASFANSQLINSSIKPLIKFSVLIAAKEEGFDFLTETEISALLTQIDGIDIDVSNDLNEIYLAVTDLLTIQDYTTWEASINDLSIIANFDSTEQALFVGALNKLVSLDLLKLADPVLNIGMYDQSVVNNITWLETHEERIALLDSVRTKINNYNGQFVASTLGDLVELFETTFYSFPGIDLDNDGTIDVTLDEFIGSLEDLSIVLNADPNYHAWFSDVLDGLGSLSAIDVFMEPLMGMVYGQVAGSDELFSQAELDLLTDIIETNFSDQADLQRELTWMSEVYQAIGNLHIGSMLKVGDSPVKIMDTLLVDSEGQTLFKATIDKFLEGQTISALTNQMSAALIQRFVTEPAALSEPLTRAALIDGFDFASEIDVLVDVLFGLYDEGMLLETAMSNDEESNILETLLPSIISFVRDETQKTKLLSSNIIYSFLDYNLTDIPMLETPSVIYETSGVYEGWIKKTELSNLLSVIDGLLTEMENHNMGIEDLLGGISDMNTFFPVIKGYAATSDNRDTLLASDIIYKTVDDLIQSIDLVEVPDTAMVQDANSPYYLWTERTELKRVLEALVIMDLDIPDGGAPMDLDSITGEQINEVILVESAVMTRLLTTYINDANIFDIPLVAYETSEALDLKQSELEALGSLLVDLDLNLGDLIGAGSSNLLESYVVSDLTALQYESSFLIKGFITYGITSGIGTPHALALDALYPEVLSETEIGEIFNILNALDIVPSMTVQALMDTLDPNTLTFGQTLTVINSGDSIVIRGLFSENLLSTQIITDLSLQDAVYHDDNGTPVYDLISYDEMQKLVAALSNLNEPEDSIVNSVDTMDTDLLTIANMIAMHDEGSSLIRTLMSDTLITYVTPQRIASAAYDTNAPGDLTQLELTNFLSAIAVLDDTYDDGDPNNDEPLTNLVTTLTATVGQLTIGKMNEMHQEASLIMQKFMSEGIVTAVTLNDIRTDAFSDVAMEMVDYDEITNLLLSLNDIALNMNSGDQVLADDETITNVVTNISTSLETGLIRNIATHESIIIYRKITNALDGALSIDMPSLALQTHAYSGNDITQTELTNLTYALEAFGLTNLDASLVDSGNAQLTNVQAALQTDSYIVDRLISEAVTNANLSTIESHQGMEDPSIDVQKDELENLVDAFIAFGINDINNAATTDMLTLYTNAQAMSETEFNGYIDYTEPYDPLTEDLGLTIVKDFLISKLDDQIPNPMDFPNNYSVSNRQELNQLIFP
ncbi:MAG: hypothetical protein WCZ19_02055 [Acholeplasma sp.]